jgi:alpha-1,6-mannosyltransferase
MGFLVALFVLAAPGKRLLVPIGAPGSTLPDWIIGPLAPLAHSSLQVGTVALALISLLLVACWLVVIRDADSLQLKPVLWVLGGIYLLLLIGPPLLSTDAFTYLSAGRLQVLHGVNPYVHGPVVRPQDPGFGWTGLIWADTPTVYGPVFTLLTAGLVPLGLAGGLWSLKLIACLSAIACAWLTWSIAEELGRPRMQAMLFVALNPIFMVYAVAGAHNDLLMLAIALLGVRFAIRTQPKAAGAALALAVAIKVTGLLILPFVVVAARERRDGAGRRVVASFAAVSLVVAVIGTLFYGFDWLAVPSTISDGAARHIGELRSVPGIIAGYLGLGPIGPVARSLLTVAAVASVVAAIGWSLLGDNRWVAGAAVSVIAALTFSTQLHPWYLVWALPFGALTTERRVRNGTIALFIAIIAIQAIRWIVPAGVGWPHGG